MAQTVTEQVEIQPSLESSPLDYEERIQQLDFQVNETKNIFLLSLLPKPQYVLYFLGVLICLGGFIYGLNVSLISGALLFLKTDMQLDTPQESLVSSGMSLGGIGGAIVAIPFNEYFGRKYSILIACLFYTVGAILEAASHSYGQMVAGRVVLGMGVALGTMTIPIYASECFPKNKRGAIVSLYTVMIMFGILSGYIVSAIFIHVAGTWRFILGSSLVFSSFLMMGVLFIPESPRWLMRKGQISKAYIVWKGLRGMDKSEEREEFFIMEKVCQSEKQVSSGRWILLDLYRIPYCRKACIHGVLLMFFQQFSGTNSILYFLGSMYRKAGLSIHDSIYISMIGGGSLFLSSIPAIYLVDSYGRRPLLLILTPGIIVGLMFIGFAFLSHSTDSLVAVYTIGVVLFYIFWGSSLGPVPFVMNAELYPNYLRTYGMSLGILSNFLGNWITSYAFLEMTRAMTKTGTFVGFYGGITALGWFYFLFMIPETKNLSLEEIKGILDRPWKDIVYQNLHQGIGMRLHHMISCLGKPSTSQQSSHHVSM
ncbi:hypothetical protein GAYE_SCF17G3747 [Galdieria yellowstonensis]|uniref:Major facilitator superfamily (MFS) profile domain-containing protein n=1 Tax=Galdieria yellowstonensis TaxID=3028027 RepID=A0AAV9IF13_9RHOD|nr:hypothetical protein GAYE_SCF17G3747 [Galdieria yellowstonensis]